MLQPWKQQPGDISCLTLICLVQLFTDPEVVVSPTDETGKTVIPIFYGKFPIFEKTHRVDFTKIVMNLGLVLGVIINLSLVQSLEFSLNSL